MYSDETGQKGRTEVSLLLVMAGDEKESWVPGPTDPVLVRERAGLAKLNSETLCAETNNSKYLEVQDHRDH